MKSNLKIIEINFPCAYANIKLNNSIKKCEDKIDSKINLTKKSLKKNCSNNLRMSLPFKGIKSIEKINNFKIQINTESYLSPKSKCKIGFLNHFNNNSIYYSNNKKEKSISHFEESKLNNEIKPLKKKLLFTENKLKNSRNIFDFPKNTNRRFKPELIEDSKNNEITYRKTNNYISSYGHRLFSNYNTENVNNYQYIQVCKKPETAKKKLLKIISEKNLFNTEKSENLTSSRNVSTNKEMNFNKNKLQNKKIPEIIIPGEYLKLKKIGEGSFGKIYKSKWLINNKNYAMKEMHFQNKDDLLYFQKKLDFIINFRKNTKCEGLIKIYGYSCIKKKEYFFYEIMELAERDWEQEINLRKKNFKYYSEKELFSIIKQLIKTLALLQKNKITHRDIKLQNILVINNKYKICDFGESRTLNQKGIISQPVRGSELYMSPILFSGLNQNKMQVVHNTFKSDMFSLGMCILFAATLDYDSLYEIREINDMYIIRNILKKYLNKRYSNNFIEILLSMLEVKEKNRPDFIQLEKLISLYENANKIDI